MSNRPAVADDIATPKQVAEALNTSLMGLAQMRYRGTGPRFIKCGSRVLYRWSDGLTTSTATPTKRPGPKSKTTQRGMRRVVR
jgi:hypothetical protein